MPIPGTTKPNRLRENIGGVAIKLTPDDLHTIDVAAAKINIPGARYLESAEKTTGR